MKKIFLGLLLVLFISGLASALPKSVNLPVPFICQAPYANWSQPYQDACEEAAIVMAMNYVKDVKNISKKEAREQILNLVEYVIGKYGEHKELTAIDVKKLISDYYHFENTEVIYNPTIKYIKEQLSQGQVIIAPTAGQLLGNPYFTYPGPAYHMLIIRGYNDGQGVFITNENGTRRGKEYKYKYNIFMNAVHEWKTSKKDVIFGRKAIIIVKKPINI